MSRTGWAGSPVERDLKDATTLVELGKSEADAATEAEGVAALKALKAEGERRQLEALLSGEADGNDSYVEVHSGAGGTESGDWARMLLRMYVRWAERRKFDVEVVEETAGDEAGIKSATVVIKGLNAHGWLKTKSGVHRLVRISPYEFEREAPYELCLGLGLSGRRRPHPDRRQRGRLPHRHVPRQRGRRAARQQDRSRRCASPISRPASWSPASRSVRSTRTGRPPGTCSAPGSMSANSRAREEKANADAASKTDIGWGHQIRSYVLQPYQMVKDLRTGHVSGTPADVLDGDLDPFMEASLAQRLSGRTVVVEDVD